MQVSRILLVPWIFWTLVTYETTSGSDFKCSEAMGPRIAWLLSLCVNESRNSLHNDFCFWMTHTVSISHPRYRNGYFLLSLHTKLLCRSRGFLSLPHSCPSEHQGRSSRLVALYFLSSVHFLFPVSTWGMASPILANPQCFFICSYRKAALQLLR